MKKSLTYTLLAAAVLVPIGGVTAYLVAKERAEQHLRDLLTETPARIVSQMTLEQKVGQLIHIGMTGKRINAQVVREIRDYHVGGVILFAANFGTAPDIKNLNGELQKTAREAQGLPLFISTDQEGGRVLRVGPDGTEQFPSALTIGQADTAEYAEDIGTVTAYELRQLGINLVLAPSLDVNNNPANPVINMRSFGSNPDVVTRMGVAYARGVRRAFSTPTIKHFPGHGDTDTDSHLDLPRISRDLPALEKTELAPFQAAIADDAEIVMTAHILFPALDAENPATLSPAIVSGLLRQKLGFDGMVMTDAMEMHAIAKRYTNRISPLRAVAAGVDVVLLTSDGPIVKEMYDALLAAFRSGEIPMQRLDDAVLRQIKLKYHKGLFHALASPHIQPEEQIDRHFAAREAAATAGYNGVRAKYTEKDGSVSLNQRVSRAGIAALRRGFAGIPAADRARVRVIARSGIMLDEARALGIPPERLFALRSTADMYRPIQATRDGEIWLVETDDRSLSAWNRLAKIFDASREKRFASAQLVGLHTGNPFLALRVPRQGAVLASFSPTNESRRALVFRALNGEAVKQADLALRPESE